MWCRRHRVPALPAAPETVALYVRDEAARLKPSTLRQRLCAICKIHRLCGHLDPTDAPIVDLAMRRVKRSQPSRPKQALGLTATLRDQLLDACSTDLIGLRDKVLVSVGFDTLCRRGELVALSVGDLTRNGQGRYSVLVRRAKRKCSRTRPAVAGSRKGSRASAGLSRAPWLMSASLSTSSKATIGLPTPC